MMELSEYTDFCLTSTQATYQDISEADLDFLKHMNVNDSQVRL